MANQTSELESIASQMSQATSDPTHVDTLRTASRAFCEAWLADDNEGQVRPQLLVRYLAGISLAPQTECNIIVSPFGTEVEKIATLSNIGRLYYGRRTMPMAWTLISAAWLSHQLETEPRTFLTPEDDPNRQDVLVCMTMSMAGKVWVSHIPLSESGTAKRAAGPWCDSEDGAAGSPLLSSFARGFFNASPLCAAKIRELARAGR